MNGRLDLPHTQRRVLDHHRHEGEVTLASGETSNVYYDIREALLCGACMHRVAEHYIYFLAEAKGEPMRVVSTGTFGAMILTTLSTRWNSVGMRKRPTSLWLQKDHGRQWVHDDSVAPKQGGGVVLLDDVITTGGTMAALERAGAEAFGWKVADRLVFLDRRYER